MRNYQHFVSLLLAITSTFTFGQTGTTVQTNPPALNMAAVLGRSVEGLDVTAGVVIADLARATENDRSKILERSDGVKQVVNNLLIRKKLAKEAERDRLTEDPYIRAMIEVARDRVLSDARLIKLDQMNEPSSSTLELRAKETYQKNPEQFVRPPQTRASHILLTNSGPESLQRARELVALLKTGASFDDMAKLHSLDTATAEKGGDLGFFGDGQMMRSFEDALATLKLPGEISDPVESQFGYHIIKLEERRNGSHASYEEVRPRLLIEARTAIINESRVQKVHSLSTDLEFDKSAIDAFVKAVAR